jgi:hypothetical protein
MRRLQINIRVECYQNASKEELVNKIKYNVCSSVANR